MPRLCYALALFALAALPFAGANAFGHELPFKVDFTFRIDVETQHQLQLKNLAPWYTYFPYDPHVHGHGPHFPTWPSTWPPTPPPPPVKKDTPPGPMTWNPSRPAWQPVSYYPAAPVTAEQAYFQLPSYWYGR